MLCVVYVDGLPGTEGGTLQNDPMKKETDGHTKPHWLDSAADAYIEYPHFPPIPPEIR